MDYVLLLTIETSERKTAHVIPFGEDDAPTCSVLPPRQRRRFRLNRPVLTCGQAAFLSRLLTSSADFRQRFATNMLETRRRMHNESGRSHVSSSTAAAITWPVRRYCVLKVTVDIGAYGIDYLWYGAERCV